MEEGDFHTLEKARINESFFLTPEAREVYRFLRETYHGASTAGNIPTVDLVRYRFPTLHFSSPPDAVSILCEQLRQEKLRIELLTLAQTLNERAGLDTASALAELRSKSIEISSMSEAGEDLSMASAYNMLWNQYSTIQNAGGITGIPYPWDALNEETQGMQNGQFIVIYGRPKSMKTWIAAYMGKHAYTRARRRVLLYTREMSPELMAGRVACLIAGVDYKSFKNGRLQPELRHRVFSILQELAEDEKAAGSLGYRQPFFIITTDRGRSGRGSGGVGWLQAKIRETQPDLVIVDGMYLMVDDRSGQRTVDWKAIAHISQDLKLTAQEFNVPLIGVTQANRGSQKSKGDDLTELAFSDALGQDADAVFRVSKQDKIDETGVRKTIIFLTAPGLREGRFDGIVIKGEPATSFDYIRTMVAEDSEQEDYGTQGKKGGGQRSSGAHPSQAPQGQYTRSPQQFMTPMPNDVKINHGNMR